MTHEEYIREIAESAIQRIPDTAMRERLREAKLTYGAGESGVRGITYFSAWQTGEAERADLVGICATGEENPIQLAGTTIHELGHVQAGIAAGHAKRWKIACNNLGLVKAEASGQWYDLQHFAPDIKQLIETLVAPSDGAPVFGSRSTKPMTNMPIEPVRFRPCPLGIGTRGGRSRGKGSGSRLRLFTCGCNPPIKVRLAREQFDATCNVCGSSFKRADGDQSAMEDPPFLSRTALRGAIVLDIPALAT